MLMHRHGLAAASAPLAAHEAVLAAVLAAAAAVALVAVAAAAAAVVLVATGVAALVALVFAWLASAALGCLAGGSRASHVSRLREGVLLTSSRCSCSLPPRSARGGDEVERRVCGMRGEG